MVKNVQKKDVDALKADLSRFRDDLSNVLSDVGQYSRSKVMDTKERLGKSMRDFQSTASTKISGAGEFVGDKTKRAVTTSRDAMSKRPFVTCGVSFAVGALAAMLMKRRSHG